MAVSWLLTLNATTILDLTMCWCMHLSVENKETIIYFRVLFAHTKPRHVDIESMYIVQYG
jgi:hypothetical protein